MYTQIYNANIHILIVITIDVSLFKQLTTNRKLISRRIRNHFGEKHQKDEHKYIYIYYIYTIYVQLQL